MRTVAELGIGLTLLGGFDLLWRIGDPEAADAGFFDHLILGISNSYGYQFGPTLHFDELEPVVEDDDGEEDTPPAPPVDMGELDLGGFTWRLGISVRYVI